MGAGSGEGFEEPGKDLGSACLHPTFESNRERMRTQPVDTLAVLAQRERESRPRRSDTERGGVGVQPLGCLPGDCADQTFNHKGFLDLVGADPPPRVALSSTTSARLQAPR